MTIIPKEIAESDVKIWYDDALREKYFSDDGEYTFEEGTVNINCRMEDNVEKGVFVKKVHIPDTVTKIGSEVFMGCQRLEEAVLPDKLEKIGDCAFLCCNRLNTIKFPTRIENIGYKMFAGCSSLEEIIIPDNVSKIDNGAFWKCICLDKVYISNNTECIGDFAFMECGILRSVTIPDSVKELGNDVFAECSLLKNIYVSEKSPVKDKLVSEYGDIVRILRNGCKNLKAVVIPKEVAESNEKVWYNDTFREKYMGYGTYCFEENTVNINCIMMDNVGYEIRVREVYIPESTESIGDSAFAACFELKKVNLGNNIKSIGERAFFGAIALKEITIPDSVTEVKAFVFDKCESLKSIYVSENSPVKDKLVSEYGDKVKIITMRNY